MTQKKKRIIIILVIMFISISGGYYIFASNNTPLADTQTTTQNTQKREYKHIFPKQISKDMYFYGEFIANDSVSIFPRRNAIVKDILVDIGDRVEKGQTLALLQNPGVIGEAGAKIQVKNTLLNNSYATLGEVKKVKQVKIEQIDRQIQEQVDILEKTMQNFDAQIQELGDQDIPESQYSIVTNELENLEVNLKNARILSEQISVKSKNKIEQKKELFEILLDESFQVIVPILYMGNISEIDYTDIRPHDFSDQFGAKDTQTRKTLIQNIQTYQKDMLLDDYTKHYTSLQQINTSLLQVLQNTIISTKITQSQLSKAISDVHNTNTLLSRGFQTIQDAIDNDQIIQGTQQEKIEKIIGEIEKKKNTLKLTHNSSLTLVSKKGLVIQGLQSTISNLKESKNLLIANENKSIISMKNTIDLARAELQEATTISGDYRVISDFSGIISKRNISIGEHIKTSQQAFGLVGVENSLSKKTKKEIKFFVQEDVLADINLGDEVTFSPAGGNNRSFTGTIYRISPEIDAKTMSVTLQAKVDETINIPNKSAIRVQQNIAKDIFQIPSSAIYNKSERTIVYYKKENGKIGVRDIVIISDDGEYSLVSGKIDNKLPVIITKIFTQ